MIIVVEGLSAVGKTTWCVAHGGDSVIAETGRVDAPTGLSDDELARFWSEINCGRWSAALDTERDRGLAVCDTDPLKLHYDYCLARVGVGSWSRFDAGVEVAAESIAAHRLGIADVVLIELADDETLARRRDADRSRRRGNFDLHRRLGPALRDWYGALDRLDPGRVIWRHPSERPSAGARERYDVHLFRSWMDQLPRQT